MKEKYVFGEIKWAYSRDERKIMIPFILNKDKNKVKDVLNEKIYDSKTFFNLINEEKCFVTSSVQMVVVYGGIRMINYKGFRHEDAYGKNTIVTKNELTNIRNIFLLGIKDAVNIQLKPSENVRKIIDNSQNF